MLSNLLFRMRSLLRRKTVEDELEDEMRFHLERQIEKHMRAGLTREEAVRRARVSFGGIDQVKRRVPRRAGLRALAELDRRPSVTACSWGPPSSTRFEPRFSPLPSFRSCRPSKVPHA